MCVVVVVCVCVCVICTCAVVWLEWSGVGVVWCVVGT